MATYRIWRKNRSLLPMHPKIMKKEKELPTEKGLPGEKSPNTIPDIPAHL